MTIGDRVSQTFHRDISGIPAGVSRPLPGMRLRYSRHALEQSDARHLKLDHLPVTLPYTFEVVEAQVWRGEVLKWLVRLPYNDVRDLCLVLNPTGYVRTLWTNDKMDNHATLQKGRYALTA